MISNRPSGVVSLLELMQRYRLDYLAVFLACCQIVSRDCMYMDGIGRESIGDEIWYAHFTKIVKGLGMSMQQMDGDRSLLAQIEAFSKQIEDGIERRPSVINAGLTPIMRGVEEILQNRLFMFVPEDQAAYYMNVKIFGDAVGVFTDALPDMLEAVNCYAFGRATACVFHSMRVAEHGLRHIANQLSINIGTESKPVPVEYATWEEVLRAIEQKRSDLRKEVKSKQHEQKTMAYANLANQGSHLKDLWRNPCMHSRGLYEMPEALGAMNRVADFMKLITASEYAPPVDKGSLAMMKAVFVLTDGITSRT